MEYPHCNRVSSQHRLPPEAARYCRTVSEDLPIPSLGKRNHPAGTT